jgi:hypothetical protein
VVAAVWDSTTMNDEQIGKLLIGRIASGASPLETLYWLSYYVEKHSDDTLTKELFHNLQSMADAMLLGAGHRVMAVYDIGPGPALPEPAQFKLFSQSDFVPLYPSEPGP